MKAEGLGFLVSYEAMDRIMNIVAELDLKFEKGNDFLILDNYDTLLEKLGIFIEEIEISRKPEFIIITTLSLEDFEALFMEEMEPLGEGVCWN